MNSDTLKGQWKEMRGGIKERWGKLTNDDLDTVAGQREKLEGAIQKRYGKARDEVKKEVDTYLADYGDRAFR